MSVRRPTPNDAHAIASAHVRAWQVAYEGIMPASYLDGLTVGASEERWRKWLGQPGSEILVADVDGVVAGFCSFGATRDADADPEAGGRPQVGEIRAINLHPDRWRCGLGSELLEASLDELRRAGSRAVSLWVLSANERARRFYEARGWQADGGSKNEGPPGCPPLEHLRYRTWLDR